MAQNAKDKDFAYDAQRRKIEKLMENPDRIVDLPDTSMAKSKNYEPPDFVRNVMGSSAGAGSGEFHVYRHLRRKEIMRLKDMEAGAINEELDRKFKEELAQTKKAVEERMIKKKSKREKKKLKKKKHNSGTAGQTRAAE